MELKQEQLNDVRTAVKYYQQYHISVTNPRYKEYEVILQLLEKDKDE